MAFHRVAAVVRSCIRMPARSMMSVIPICISTTGITRAGTSAVRGSPIGAATMAGREAGTAVAKERGAVTTTAISTRPATRIRIQAPRFYPGDHRFPRHPHLRWQNRMRSPWSNDSGKPSPIGVRECRAGQLQTGTKARVQQITNSGQHECNGGPLPHFSNGLTSGAALDRRDMFLFERQLMLCCQSPH